MAVRLCLLPAFDFVYGGGMTHTALSIVHRRRGRLRVRLSSLALSREQEERGHRGRRLSVWLFFVTREWRREIAFASAGHLSEFILAGILFYKAMSAWMEITGARGPAGRSSRFRADPLHLFAWR